MNCKGESPVALGTPRIQAFEMLPFQELTSNHHGSAAWRQDLAHRAGDGPGARGMAGYVTHTSRRKSTDHDRARSLGDHARSTGYTGRKHAWSSRTAHCGCRLSTDHDRGYTLYDCKRHSRMRYRGSVLAQGDAHSHDSVVHPAKPYLPYRQHSAFLGLQFMAVLLRQYCQLYPKHAHLTSRFLA